MSQHELQRVEALFQAAADLSGDDRTAYLDRECADDADLRKHVERLLDRLALDDPLELPTEQRAMRPGPFPAAAVTEGPGTTIGRYKLLQVIGEGGFGVVYMAEQVEPVRRKVALKIIKMGMDTREVVARFEAERQALAMMDHPHIARVLDGGATESGRPYFVMELVRGVSITEYCDRNDVGTRERLALFVQVCNAIQHAHQKGVIHRDLKPSNVLVTLHDDGDPIPKVIDFGVAKAMHTPLTEKTLFTRYEQFIGTPAYMSPEQAEMSALDVDTRTDIYSLGVLLYELLTGTTPFDSRELLEAGLGEIQRIIREQQPPRPSARISTTADAAVARHRRADVPGLSRALRGDLDWIVMKALEKDRARRFATASELAEDIGRHLRHEPVIAGPPGAGYRLRKLLARHRAAVASVAIIALALVGGIVATSVMKIRADHSAAQAKQQADYALSALDFLVSTLALTDPEVALDPEVTVLTLLQHTADQVADAFADQPWAEIRVRAAIGKAYNSLADDTSAEPHLRRVVELVDEQTDSGRDWSGSPGFDAGDYRAILWTLTNVAFNLERPDSFAVAQRAHETGIAWLIAHDAPTGEQLQAFYQATAKDSWSSAPDAMAGVPELFDRVVRTANERLPRGSDMWPIIADTFLATGYMVWYTPHEPLSEHFFGAALDIQRRELPPTHPDIATTVGLLVNILNNLGRGAEAEQLIRDSIASLTQVHHADDYPVAVAQGMLGETLTGLGRFEEAEPILLGSHAVIVATLRDPTNFMAIESLQRVIGLYDAWGRPEAGRPYRDTLADIGARGRYVMQWTMIERTLGPHQDTLAELMGRFDELCGGVSYLVASGTATGDGIDPLLDELLAEHRRVIPTDDLRAVAIARFLPGWANTLDPDTQRDARRRLAEATLATLGDAPALDHARALAILADVANRDGDHAASADLARQAWNLLGDRDDAVPWFDAATQVRIGRVLMRHGMHEQAETLMRPGLEVMAAQIGPDHPDTLTTRALLHELYASWGKPEAAREFTP